MKNMKSIVILASCFLPLLIVPVMGESSDGTINLTQRPSLKLDEAMSAAKDALGADAKDYSCTIAKSKTKASGGGWMLQFRSRTLPFRWIRIDEGGKVRSNEVRPGLAAHLKGAPSVAIEKALEVALATRDKPRRWFAVMVEWVEETDEWLVMLVSYHQDAVHLTVDSKEKARERKQ